MSFHFYLRIFIWTVNLMHTYFRFSTSSSKNFHPGLKEFIKSIFLLLRQPFISFSLKIACFISV